MASAEELNRALDRAEGLIPHLSSNNTIGTSTINVNAGGVGIWVCTTACLMSLMLCAVMAVMFLDMNRKYDRTQDLLSVIYQQAPWLKPPVEKKD